MIAYRYLTEEDTSAFCHKVSKALSEGWQLYGEPSYVFDPSANVMRCAQAVMKENADLDYTEEMKLSAV